jgi:hypothetical protein
MKSLLVTLLIIFGVVIIVGLGSVLLVLWAYGAGQVMLRILPSSTFSPFEATLLNLVGVLIVGLLVVRIVTSATTSPHSTTPSHDEDIEDEDWEDDIELEDEEEDNSESDPYPGIPRWRRPLKKIDFTNVKPNDPCPCGSGRKYKNCHGYKRAEGK